ncbi:MAG: amino acid permease family protein [Bacteroidetes bacterium]|nr:amino acid permease family protein [Bacteroidota bacterium]
MNGKIKFPTALSVVIANMIGTGVFTSLGYQLPAISDFSAIIALWMIGGVVALFGAFAYSELGAALPRSGGEYNFLSEIYHPSVGFLSGWVSATIGFAAPIAAASWALGKYFSTVIPGLSDQITTRSIGEHQFHIALFSPQMIGAGVIILVTIIQSINYAIGGGFQTVATAIKVLLIIVFIIFGLLCACNTHISIVPTAQTYKDVFSAPFAISLVYVSFAYSGWNASSYIAGEVDNPKRNIPLSILIGTLLVTILYIMINYVFLRTAPVEEMKGVNEVAFISAKYIFGDNGAKLISLIISVLLVSTISSMVIVGPRVIQMIGEDYSIFRVLSRKNKNGIPVIAIVSQSVIALVLLFSSSFDMIITYISFTLSLFTTLTVLGVFVLRYQKPNLERPYRTWGYPVTPAIFLILNCWFIWFVLKGKPAAALVGFGVLAVGLVVYFVAKFLSKNKEIKSL